MDVAIVLVDGVCNLCNSFVRFVIRRDPHERFRFASLQSARGRELLGTFDLPAEVLTSVVLIEGNRCFTRSTAALRVVRRLRMPWPLLYALIALPRFLRDAMYDFVAKRRYAWFGRSETCAIPTPEIRARFLDGGAGEAR